MDTHSLTPIVICADDYAQSAAITNGILELLASHRLSAISCMTDSPRWSKDASALRPWTAKKDIGLHFNLTHDFGQGAQTLAGLLWHCSLGIVDQAWVRKALERQLENFHTGLGCEPDFIDGHQHVHTFPVIRDILLEYCSRRYPGKKPYLRRVNPDPNNAGARAKAALLRQLDRGFAKAALVAEFKLNTHFAGLYSLSPMADFPGLMRQWLAQAPPGTLLMVHPGQPCDDTTDPISSIRSRELAYLSSEEFVDDCRNTKVQPGRLFAHPGN